MDNNEPKIGCRFGENDRTKIIDPNAFYGEKNSSRNIPVRIEDLTISVKLTTRKKSRTTIATDNNDVIVKEQKGATINFIEGSTINNKKTLTTKFTELTTVFDTDSLNPETFGITNIDIDFNSSYTPMIKIDFVDVRGSSIFQNEEQLTDNNAENKYAIFFEFPYPLFELEIKGYYGQPVTYCLHMLKFNSKFNSETGNFEISCEFIGYTYALLSDMLIGVLRAIPFTKIGGEKFEKYNDERIAKGFNPILKITELRTAISKISDAITKASLKSEDSKKINSFNDALDYLNKIKFDYFSLIDKVGFNKDVSSNQPEDSRFIIMDNTEFTDSKTTSITETNNSIIDSLKKYNELNIQGLSLTQADIVLPTRITNLTLKKLEPDYDIGLENILKDNEAVDSFKKDLKNYITNSFTTFSEEKLFSVYDLRSRYLNIENQEELLKKALKDTQKSLAVQIKDTVSVTLGFDPTIRNMVEIFTASIEVFIETIYDVSKSAENNIVRKELLQNVFGENLIKGDYTDTINYYPWPAYSEKDNETTAYVDKYLGTNPQVKSRIPDVDELNFINDLLKAFLTANEEEKQSELLNEANNTLFIPANPLDTQVFNVIGNPYASVDMINTNQPLRTFLIRAMIFLGYSNDQEYLTEDEIQKMAQLEARMLNDALINVKTKLTLLGRLSPVDPVPTILNTVGTLRTGGERKIVVKTNLDNYSYNYVNKGDVNDIKILPIGYDIEGEDLETFYQKDAAILTVVEQQEKLLPFAGVDNEKLFLTNYGGKIDNIDGNIFNLKFNDGGVYVKIKKPSEITPTFEKQLYDTTLPTEMVLDLKALKESNIAEAGFNSFGGAYGVPDYNTINFGEEFNNQPKSMYVFYSNTLDVKLGLAYTRNKTAKINDKKTIESKWDFVLTSSKNLGFPGLPIEQRDLLYKVPSSPDGKYIHEKLGKNRELAYNIKNIDEITYPYINQYLSKTAIDTFVSNSLFGSKWYYLQKNNTMFKFDNTPINNIAEDYVRGLLFLNTLPFNMDYNKPDPFEKPEIKHLFDIKGGFIHAPRLWVAYVGGLFWWLSEDDPKVINGKIVGGGRGITDPINWGKYCGAIDENDFWEAKPKKNQYLPKLLERPNSDIDNESLLLTLPLQVQEEFKKVFFDFINGDLADYVSFKSLKESLEIFDGDPLVFCELVDKLDTLTSDGGFLTRDENKGLYYFNGDVIKDNFKNYGNYKVITPVSKNSFQKDGVEYIFLELNDKSNVVDNLLTAFDEELIIVNTGYKIWKPKIYSKYREGVTVKEEFFEEYLKAFTLEFKNLNEGVTLKSEEERQLNEVFGQTNKDEIKLMLYRHCKNIYDKWLGGVTDPENVIFQCGDNSRVDSNRKTTDAKLGDKYGYTKPRLIHSFRFVTRSFKDIGDELFVDPTPIEKEISETPNTSAYSVISTLLNDNKFEFIALPTFINYRDDKMLESVFTPQPYTESITSCGPTFVCVYTGQKSNSLDINSGRYPNDGFDMRCDSTTIPDDFKSPLNDYEDPIAVFEVNYSQQNQNIFKNIGLDQSEFTETEESLKIVQDISMQGFENKPTFAGQNMYNIYGIRSYSAEIEMLGNAMIQPMMYFQLNNIPMFHGAYMIIKVKHNIKPNYMSTSFTGTRIRAIESPIIDVTDIYMNLIETLDLSEVGNASNASVFGSTPNSSSPIIQTLINNGVSASNVNQGYINLCDIKTIKGVSFELNPNKQMICEAVEPFTKMLTDWVNWMIGEEFKPIKVVGNEKIYVYVTSIFRTEGSNSAHSFGIAVDLQMGNKEGVVIPNNAGVDSSGNKKIFSLPEYFNFETNPALKWLYNNSYKYGFVQPYWANDGKGDGNNSEEHWHWEYHGKSAICMLRKQPIPGLGGNKTSDNPLDKIKESNIFNFVKNPLEPDGNEAVYTDCDYKTTVTVTDKYNNITGDLSTISNDPKIFNKQKEVKDFLKNKGLTKSQVAGIMGNIHKETGGKFDPLSVNKRDLNGYPSVGLIQWNGKFTPKNGSKDSNVILSTIGKTVNEQLTYLTTNSNEYRQWLNLPDSNNTKTSAYDAAFEFARLVEICAGCKTKQVYKTNEFKPFERSLFANDYLNRFNDSKDNLYW